MPRSRSLAYLILILNTALWGFSAPIIKYSFQFVSPSLFLFYRFIAAALIFLPIFLVYRSRHRHRINHPQTVFLALLGAPLCLLPLFYGLKLTTAVEASLLESTSPLLTILLCVIFLGEKLKSHERRGLFLALAGTLLIALEPLLTGHNHLQLSLRGNFLIILGNLVWAVFLLLSKKFKTDPVYLSFYSFLVSIPFFFFISQTQAAGFNLNTAAIPGILYMAIGGSIIGFWTYMEGQKRIEASEAAVFSYLKPVFAIPLSVLWLKEPFSPIAILATLIIIVGVFVSEKR